MGEYDYVQYSKSITNFTKLKNEKKNSINHKRVYWEYLPVGKTVP